jgi:hypothetical protein
MATMRGISCGLNEPSVQHMQTNTSPCGPSTSTSQTASPPQAGQSSSQSHSSAWRPVYDFKALLETTCGGRLGVSSRSFWIMVESSESMVSLWSTKEEQQHEDTNMSMENSDGRILFAEGCGIVYGDGKR